MAVALSKARLRGGGASLEALPFLLPAYGLFLLFMILPVLEALWLSLHREGGPPYLLAGLYAFLLVLPLLTLLSASLRSEADLYAPGLLPPGPSLEPYREALTKYPLARFLLNSLLVSTAVTLEVLATSLLAAYALVRMRFPGREALFLMGSFPEIRQYVQAAWEETLKGKPAGEALREAKAKADAALERYNRSASTR